MRKIIAIAILVVLAYNIIGTVAVFKVIQARMKSEFLHGLNKDLSSQGLAIICYSSETKANFSMLEEHELCYNGNMYDIVREERKDGNRIFYCVSDKAETHLIANMECSIDKSINQVNHNGTAQILIMFMGLYVLPDSKINLFVPKTEKLFTNYISKTKESPFIGLHFPPPKIG